MKCLRDYHDLYLKTDVLLLADVFENFRDLTMKNYGLDAAHFITTPGVTMCAALKFTEVHLELLRDINMLNFFEGGIRGGVSCIMNRYAKANHPSLPNYDETAPIKNILYLDMNNLYGRAMIDPLPVSGFRWLSRDEIVDLKPRIQDIADDAEIGCALEVDLDYPDNLHDKHNDYPLSPEHLDITSDMLSPYSRHLLQKLGKKLPSKNHKLVPNLMPKRNYIVHYRNLKFYLEMGLKLRFIHKVIEFKQSKWLAPYIDFNTNMRKEATTDFEKNLYKLMNNAVFGKMCEDLRKRIDVRLVSSQPAAERYIAQPNFDSFKILNEDVTMIKMNKTSILWRKPTFVGFTILELSKLHMYKFHYKHLVPLYTYGGSCKAKLLFTDTDSLCYEITTPDLYGDMLRNSNFYDTSNYDRLHDNYSETNAKVVGKMKDECGGVMPLEFVGLRAKMYSLLLPGEKEKSTAKGVKRSHAKKYVKHCHYKSCLVEESQTAETFHILQSKNHEVETKQVTKLALSCYDDKRYLRPDSTDTYAYGHIRIRKFLKTV